MKYLLLVLVIWIVGCKVQQYHEDLDGHMDRCKITETCIDSANLIIYDSWYRVEIKDHILLDTLTCVDTCYVFSYGADRPYYSTLGRHFSPYFSVSGTLYDVGNVTNSKKQGTWETLYEVTDSSGADFSWTRKHLLLFTSVYKDGLRDGPFVAYNIYTSKVLYKTVFVNGTGYEKTYYQCKGTPIRSEGQFTHDKKTGKWIYYTVDGKKTVVYY